LIGKLLPEACKLVSEFALDPMPETSPRVKSGVRKKAHRRRAKKQYLGSWFANTTIMLSDDISRGNAIEWLAALSSVEPLSTGLSQVLSLRIGELYGDSSIHS
jgi:hypothetical protein